MKKSTIYNLLSYFWLIQALVTLMAFMASPDLNVQNGLTCLVSLGMFWFNSWLANKNEIAEAADKQKTPTE